MMSMISLTVRNSVSAKNPIGIGRVSRDRCDRLLVGEAALSVSIAAVRYFIPDHRSEDIGETLAAHAAAGPEAGRPGRDVAVSTQMPG